LRNIECGFEASLLKEISNGKRESIKKLQRLKPW
jgi:hypothetical protein